ncbi:MAG: hypothetical protein WCH75_19755 [Candidatus Binatia bacterium]
MRGRQPVFPEKTPEPILELVVRSQNIEAGFLFQGVERLLFFQFALQQAFCHQCYLIGNYITRKLLLRQPQLRDFQEICEKHKRRQAKHLRYPVADSENQQDLKGDEMDRFGTACFPDEGTGRHHRVPVLYRRFNQNHPSRWKW